MNGYEWTRIFLDSMPYLLKPGLQVIQHQRKQTQPRHDDPKERHNQAPHDERTKIVLPRFIFANEGPDKNHHHADARQGDDEQGKKPEPKGDVVSIFAAVCHGY